MVVDGSIEADGDVYAPIEEALEDPGVGIAGPFGITTRDLRTFEERALTEGKAQPIVVSHYPRVSQAFYKRRDPSNPEIVLGFDVIAGDDVGEVVGGSERETDLEYLKQAIVAFGEDPKSYEWYLDTRRFGNVQHAGFGMGMERLLQWICKLDHIRDAIAFPRTPARFAP